METRRQPAPGLVDALVRADINGRTPPDEELTGILALLIGGGFDTTAALTTHALERLSRHPGERDLLSRERGTLLDSATEEFLRFPRPRATALVDRMPDHRCNPDGTVHHETIGIIQGMRHLPAAFTPGERLGPSPEETLETLQKACDEQGLAGPVTERPGRERTIR